VNGVILVKELNSTEIARLAGVSRSTVSRVVNGYANVPPETRDRVMKVINENEYYPLFSGQLLAGKRTGTLGFFWISDTRIADDSQSSSFVVHVTEGAASHGYLILTSILKNLTDEENINWVKRVFLQKRIDAGIFVGVNNNEPLLNNLAARGNILGIFDYYRPDQNAPNLISINFETDTGAKVIDYVRGLGHRKIAVINSGLNHYSSMTRRDSFLDGMMRHNIEIRDEWIYCSGITEESGYSACKEMLANCRELPTVICANNDAVAFGIYSALGEAGISIPEQMSVTGIDGHIRAKSIVPPLTSFAFDFKSFFCSLVSRTIAAIDAKPDNPVTEFMSSELVERGSCLRIG
jgi:LacI family transcriptional regulator